MIAIASFAPSGHAEDPITGLKQLLLMPGELVEAHADLEGECDLCHVHFDKANKTALCLECHEDIAADVETQRRFHGRLQPVQTADCVSCHSEHLGRQADIIGLDPDRFDHDMTEFVLDGSHQELRCGACHEPGSGFRLDGTGCADCHRDPHDDQLGVSCGDCHATSGWSETKFDHDETNFPLEGTHQKVSCSSCHRDAVYDQMKTRCVDCHLGKDQHVGRLGTKCGDCHQPAAWDKTSFDHFRATGFELMGRHQSIACSGCHRQDLAANLPTDCVECHRSDDVHRGANGVQCADCHAESGWDETRFDHDSDTDFPLLDAHREVTCEGCHGAQQGGPGSEMGKRCVDCHEKTDPHRSRLGDSCEQCHNTGGWLQDVQFSHDFTPFPLTASHQQLPCEACHFSPAFDDASGQCRECHGGDDVHGGSLGDSCDQCHNTAAWISWRFDHAKQTSYPLQGAHEELTCALCHTGSAPSSLQPSTRCIECHEDDDVHRGGFGSDCSNCHGTEVFDDVR